MDECELTRFDHPIDVIKLDSDYHLPRLSDSVVMVWLGSELSRQSRQVLTASLVRAAPLAILAAGVGASVLWNDLVAEISSRPLSLEHPLIMMYSSAMGPCDAVDQLFCGTWPSEERWTEWARYTVIIVGTEPAELRHALREGSDQR